MSQSICEHRTPFDWEARFRADNAPWERDRVHPAIAYWREIGALALKARVYVPGCGRGREPGALARAGFAVTASDIAPTAARFQTEALAPFAHARMIETDSLQWRPDTAFDALYEQTFLCAIHPRQRVSYERMAFEVLRPGGAFMALFMQKDERGGPPYGCSLQAMQDLFCDTRWIWPELSSLKPFPHPGLNDKAELGAVLIRR